MKGEIFALRANYGQNDNIPSCHCHIYSLYFPFLFQEEEDQDQIDLADLADLEIKNDGDGCLDMI